MFKLSFLILVFSVLSTGHAIAQTRSEQSIVLDPAVISRIMDQLEIEHDGGSCLYSKKVLTRTQLNRKYGKYKTYTSNVITEPIDLSTHWKCQFIKQHIKRDTKSCDVDPVDVLRLMETQAINGINEIQGKIKYLGLVKKKYKYTVDVSNPDRPIAILKIHFQKSEKESFELYEAAKLRIQLKLITAQRIWTDSAGGKFGFNFSVVDDANDAHFSVKLVSEHTRGPYDTEWSARWSKFTIAHEIGHMLGLDDEYDNGRLTSTRGLIIKKLLKDPRFENASKEEIFDYANIQTSRCSNKSFMCSSSSGKIQNLHLYQIFKRAHCQTQKL